MLKPIKSGVVRGLNSYVARLCRKEFESQTFSRFNERPVEFGFVLRKMSELYPRTILDVGTGTTALPHLLRNCGAIVTATDNVRDYWPTGMVNRHYHVIDDDIRDTRIRTQFDMVTCISVLEHIPESDAAVRNMLGLVKPGGHLLLTFPYNERGYVRNVYALPGSSYGQKAPYITQSYSREQLNHWLSDNEAVIVDQEYWRFWEGEYWTVGKQLIPPAKVGVSDAHQLSCVQIRKR